MVKDKTIIADGWLIRVLPYQTFLDFVGGLAERWNTPDEENKRQLNGFIEAIETEVRTAFPKDPEGAQEEGFDRRS